MNVDKLKSLQDRSDSDFSNGEYTFYEPMSKRIFKACKGCGRIARSANLNYEHFHKCQPYLRKGKSGFLKFGALPERNEVDFKMAIKIIGVDLRRKRDKTHLYEESESDSTESEDSECSESEHEANELNREQVFSQESFGLTSSNSKSTITKMSTNSQSDIKLKGEIHKSTPDISSGWKQPTKADIKAFFAPIKQPRQLICDKMGKVKTIQTSPLKKCLDHGPDRYLDTKSTVHCQSVQKSVRSSSSTYSELGSNQIKPKQLGFKRQRPSTIFVPKKVCSSESNKRQRLDCSISKSCNGDMRNSQIQSPALHQDTLHYIKNIYDKSPTSQRNLEPSHPPSKEIQTQTQCHMIHKSKMVEQFEQALIQYPRERVMQLERFLEIEKSRYADLQKEYNELSGKFNDYNNLSGRVADMNDKIQEMAGKVQGDILPATLKVIKLKTQIAKMYKEMGHDDTTVQFKTFVDAEEFDQLGPVVGTMLNKAQSAQNQKSENSDDYE